MAKENWIMTVLKRGRRQIVRKKKKILCLRWARTPAAAQGRKLNDTEDEHGPFLLSKVTAGHEIKSEAGVCKKKKKKNCESI